MKHLLFVVGCVLASVTFVFASQFIISVFASMGILRTVAITTGIISMVSFFIPLFMMCGNSDNDKVLVTSLCSFGLFMFFSLFCIVSL